MTSAPREVRLDTSLETLLEHSPAAGAAVLATLVATAGSTYRKPGARMLIRQDGSFFGLLSGGCLEADLGIHAGEVLQSRQARALDYDLRGPDDSLFGIGAGCEGAMRILLEPLQVGSPASAALAHAGEATRSGRGTALVMVHRSSRLPLGTYDAAALAASTSAAAPRLLAAAQAAVAARESAQIDVDWDGARDRAFVQYLAPPPNLLICGAGPDAQPVASAALTLGWRVTLVDHRPVYANPLRFPGATVLAADARALASRVRLDSYHAVVVMSHHLPSDVAYLRALATDDAPDYVGLLGPAARRRRIALELGSGCGALLERLRGPVGIDIGAATPEAIALSIVSEIHACLAGRVAARASMVLTAKG
jgi:xanthine/CO dehydrogenase XdhC/CoxF family maturation factor